MAATGLFHGDRKSCPRPAILRKAMQRQAVIVGQPFLLHPNHPRGHTVGMKVREDHRRCEYIARLTKPPPPPTDSTTSATDSHTGGTEYNGSRDQGRPTAVFFVPINIVNIATPGLAYAVPYTLRACYPYNKLVQIRRL